MQQSSATPKNQRCREGVAEDCCMLSILLAVPSCIYSFWHGVIPTSYLIFNDLHLYVQGQHIGFSRNEHTHVVTIPTSEPPTRTIHLIGTLATVTDQYSQRILKWPRLGSSVIMWMDRDVES